MFSTFEAFITLNVLFIKSFLTSDTRDSLERNKHPDTLYVSTQGFLKYPPIRYSNK